MKATPIAEFLARKSARAPARAPLPSQARSIREATPRERRRRADSAAPASSPRCRGVRPSSRRWCVRSTPTPSRRGASRRRRRSAPPAAAAEPPADIEAQLSEAYHRGVQEGLDAGKAEAATARAMERAEMQKRAVDRQARLPDERIRRVNEAIANGFAEMERRVAQAAAQLLKPLLVEAVSRQIVEELAENVARLTRAGGIALLKVRGTRAAAGAKAYVEREKLRGETLAAVACGANMDFDRLRFVAERAEVGEKREAILAVTIPEERGSFRRFCELVGNRSVTEFNYRIADSKEAHIFVGLSVHDRADIAKLVKTLNRHHFKTLDLTDDELAKLHVRHMVGGHSPLAHDELCSASSCPSAPAH